MPRWSVNLIRKRDEHLGTVVAPNEKEAIELAIMRFDDYGRRQGGERRYPNRRRLSQNDADAFGGD